MRVVWASRDIQPQPNRYLPPAIRPRGQKPWKEPESKLPRWHHWRAPSLPSDAPPPDYGDFWQRYPQPPEGLVAPLSPEAPIEAILHGPRIRAIMGRLAVDEYLEEEGAHLSNLVPIHRVRYDHAYERDMLRQLKLANELTEKEYGPRPLYTPSPQPKRKPDLSFRKPTQAELLWQAREQALAQTDAPEQPAQPAIQRDPVFTQQSNEQEIDDMNLKQMTIAGALTVAAAVGAVDAVADDQLRYLHPGESYSLDLSLDKSHEHERDWVDVRFNSHPTQIYGLTLTIHDAPGPLEPGGANADYVPDATCVLEHKDDEIPFSYTGYVNDWFKWPNKKISTVYRTYVATDLMIGEDYYGKGVCNWTIDKFNFNVFRGNKTNPHQIPWQYEEYINFTSTIQGANIPSGKEIKTYFLKDYYNNPEQSTGLAGNPVTEEEYLKTPESERSKYFYTTLSVQKVNPKPSLQHWIWLKYRDWNP
jgi:hypothetical protein